MTYVAIDARLARSSGIGTYIRQVVPRVFSAEGKRRCAILGGGADLECADLRAIPGATHHRCDSRVYSVREQLELRRSTPAEADAFWSPHYNIPLLSRLRLLVTVHDVLHLARPEFVRGAHRRAYARGMYAALRTRAERIIADSRFTADELVRHAKVPAERICVIHLGVGESWFAAPSARSPQPRPYFLYVGNVKPHKNLTRLVAAFRLLMDELPHDLIVIGRKSGFISGDRAVLASASRHPERIRFAGEVSDEELRDHVAHAEALVLPSLYEGFGLPALEAMAAGCPVVVSRAASLPEVCGEAALYFDPYSPAEMASRMQRLATDRTLRDELVRAGRERARSFTWQRCADGTREVLDRVVEA